MSSYSFSAPYGPSDEDSWSEYWIPYTEDIEKIMYRIAKEIAPLCYKAGWWNTVDCEPTEDGVIMDECFPLRIPCNEGDEFVVKIGAEVTTVCGISFGIICLYLAVNEELSKNTLDELHSTACEAYLLFLCELMVDPNDLLTEDNQQRVYDLCG